MYSITVKHSTRDQFRAFRAFQGIVKTLGRRVRLNRDSSIQPLDENLNLITLQFTATDMFKMLDLQVMLRQRFGNEIDVSTPSLTEV